MRKIHRLDLDFTKDIRSSRKITFKEQDSITFYVNIYNDSVPVELTGITPRLFIRKSDGTILYQTEVLQVQNNTVAFDVHRQGTTCPGMCYAEIELIEGDDLITTRSFVYLVEPKVGDIENAIASVDEAYFLKVVEDFIKQAKIDIEEFKATVSTLEQKVEDANAKLNEFDEKIGQANIDLEDEKNKALEEIIVLSEESISNIDGMKDNIIALIEDTSKDAIKDFEDKVNNTNVDFDELKNSALEDFVVLTQEGIQNINQIQENSINLIVDTKDASLEALDEAVRGFKDEVDTSIEEALETADRAIENITATKDEAILEIETSKEELEGVITQANTTKTDLEGVVEVALTTKEELEGTIEDANTTKDELITTKNETKEEIDEIVQEALDTIEANKNGTVEGVDIALKDAQKRLQEEVIKSLWEVQEESQTQQEALEAYTGTKKSELDEVAQAKKEEVAEAGSEIVEMVEGLEANIEQGLADINSTINTGKTEITELGSGYLSRIEQEGQEIIDAVANLEMTTVENIKRINETGKANLDSLESKTNACMSEISGHTGEKKQEINELAQAKLEALSGAGNEKLDEINAILGVSKGEVEELLDTTRNEINTHRTQINTTVNEGITNITNLKNSSLSLMEETKDACINEILGAEAELKEDFNKLRDDYIKEIDDKGKDRVEILNNLIERINNFIDAVNSKLEVADLKAENLQNTLLSVDAKMEEVRPLLDSLETMRAICEQLKAENQEANENIEELQFLHTEADTRIVELRRLIDEAKKYEEIVQRYIDAQSGNHDDIEFRLATIEVELISIQTLIEELSTRFDNYYTKEEVDSLIPDISNLATKEELETAVNGIEIPEIDHLATKVELEEAMSNIDMSGYYTKEEVDEKETFINSKIATNTEAINDIKDTVDNLEFPDTSDFVLKEEFDGLIEHLATKEELEDKFKILGVVGESITPACYNTAPEPADNVVGELWVQDKNKDNLVLHYRNLSKITAYISKQTDSASIQGHSSDYDVYKWDGTSWVKTTGYSSIYLPILSNDQEIIENAKKYNIFYSTHDIRKDSASYPTLYFPKTPKSTEKVYNDYNSVIEEGRYKIRHLNAVNNCPAEIIDEGILKVDVVKDEKMNTTRIYQEATTEEGKVFIRSRNDKDVWTNWIMSSGVDMNNLLTKEDHKDFEDRLDIVEGASVGYKGTIGLNTKVATDTYKAFNDVPQAPEVAGSEYIGKMFYSYYSSSKVNNYVAVYFYKETSTNKEAVVYTSIATNNTGKSYNIRAVNATSTTTKTFSKTGETGTWSSPSYGLTNFNDGYPAKIYHNDINIYTDQNKTDIYRKAVNPDVIGNVNNITQEGRYLVDIKQSEYKDITGLPEVKLTKDLTTTLYVYVKDDVIVKEITIEGITYTKSGNKEWIGLHDNFINKEIIATIKNEEVETINTRTSEIDEIYNSFNLSNTHYKPYGIMDFVNSNGVYYRYITFSEGSGFYATAVDGTTSKTVGAFDYDRRFIARYVYQNGAWSEITPETSSSYSYLYLGIGTTGKVIACNLDIYKASSSSSWDKTVVIRKADKVSEEKTINDFNNATETGYYNYIGDDSINTPKQETGLLRVLKTGSYIEQELKTTSGDIFTRMFDGSEWTEWGYGNLNKNDKETIESVKEEIESVKDKFKPGKIEILQKFEWDTVDDKTIYNNLPVPSDYKSVFCGKLGNYFMVAFFNREIEAELLSDSSGKKYIKVRDYKFADVIGSYYRSGSNWAKEGQSYVDKYYGGVTGSGYNLTACFYNDFKIYNADGTLYKDTYLNKDKRSDAEDFNDAIIYNTYEVIQKDELIANSPIETPFSGMLDVIKTDNMVKQELIINEDVSYTRIFNGEWTEWKNASEVEVDLSGLATKDELNDLKTPFTDKIQSFNYTNSDGMTEAYKWVDNNGYKMMWIDVALSESEFNSGSAGAMMKTLNFPPEVQIFNNIIMANITSYNRSSYDTLSRVVQNVEIISPTSVRGRWRHTDNTYPRIDRFTILIHGY